MRSSSPLVQTLGQSIFTRHAPATDFSILAETAKFLHLLDDWFTDQDVIYMTVGTITVTLPLPEAEGFVRGLLQRYDEGVSHRS